MPIFLYAIIRKREGLLGNAQFSIEKGFLLSLCICIICCTIEHSLAQNSPKAAEARAVGHFARICHGHTGVWQALWSSPRRTVMGNGKETRWAGTRRDLSPVRRSPDCALRIAHLAICRHSPPPPSDKHLERHLLAGDLNARLALHMKLILWVQSFKNGSPSTGKWYNNTNLYTPKTKRKKSGGLSYTTDSDRSSSSARAMLLWGWKRWYRSCRVIDEDGC